VSFASFILLLFFQFSDGEFMIAHCDYSIYLMPESAVYDVDEAVSSADAESSSQSTAALASLTSASASPSASPAAMFNPLPVPDTPQSLPQFATSQSPNATAGAASSSLVTTPASMESWYASVNAHSQVSCFWYCNEVHGTF
jgi:hypothetical protein